MDVLYVRQSNPEPFPFRHFSSDESVAGFTGAFPRFDGQPFMTPCFSRLQAHHADVSVAFIDPVIAPSVRGIFPSRSRAIQRGLSLLVGGVGFLRWCIFVLHSRIWCVGRADALGVG